MAWALRFDGVNDYLTLPSLAGGDFDDRLDTSQDWYIEFCFIRAGADGYVHRILDSTVGRDQILFRASDGLFRVSPVSSGDLNWSGVPMPLGQEATYRIERIAGGLTYELFVDTGSGFVSQGVQSTVTTVIQFNVIGRNETSGYINGDLKYFKYISLSNPAQNIDLDATSSVPGNVPPIGSPVLVDIIGTNDAAGVNMPTDGSAWIDLGGGGLIDVTLATVGYNCSGNNLNVDVTSEVQIALNTASYTYSSNNLDVVITPEIKIDLGQGGYAVTAQGLDVTPTIDVSLGQGSYNLTGDGLLVDVGANISIPLSQDGYSISGDGLNVSVTGEVNIPLPAYNYTYNANKLIITIGEPTEIGAVTASFKENPVSVNFSINNVTVKFRG